MIRPPVDDDILLDTPRPVVAVIAILSLPVMIGFFLLGWVLWL